MFGLKIAFDQPWWLLLLLLIPVLWIFSFRGLSGLGPYRRIFALAFRTFVFTLLVFALAGVQLQKISDKIHSSSRVAAQSSRVRCLSSLLHSAVNTHSC